MFLGFPILRGLSIMPLEGITFDEFMSGMFAVPEVDLTNARLLDTYSFEVEGMKYEQKVYRLKDGALYKETKLIQEAEIELHKKALQADMEKAVAKQDFEMAAALRDQIKKLA